MPQISVITGFLGAGKTSIILSLLSKLPSEEQYKIVLLKNEYGDIAVDSELAKESNIKVKEMLNGCLCCVLVGQMKNALEEINQTMSPDRIIIETSGTAFPAPIAWQIREMSHEFQLDSIITVIDCVNFKGYEDTSYTAKLQAKFTDLIILNKHELITERELDILIDKVNGISIHHYLLLLDLNTDTPKVKFNINSGISPEIVFGIDSKLFQLENRELDKMAFKISENHHDNEIDIIQIFETNNYSRDFLDEFLNSLSTEYFYRVKGVVLVDNQLFILNWAFGRSQYTVYTSLENKNSRLTIMGVELCAQLQKVKQAFASASLLIKNS